MITGNQLEVLVSLVLGLDAVVIAGVVVSRLVQRRSSRQEGAPAMALPDAPYPGPGFSQPEHASGTLMAPVPVEPDLDVDALPSLEEVLEEMRPPRKAAPTVEAVEASTPMASTPTPAGLDFGPTWVDPLELAATAAAEWRHTLRRDLARAAHRGWPAMVMHLKLDIESQPDLPIQQVAHFEGLLLDTLNSLVRSSDHVDRTGPGHFHLILSEMPESGTVAIAERIRRVFAEDAPNGPRLLIGWAAMDGEADIALAIQRAAERVDDGQTSLRGGDVDR